MEARAETNGGKVFCDGRGGLDGKTSFEVGGSDGAAENANAVEMDFVVGNDGWEGVRGGANVGECVGGCKDGGFVGTEFLLEDVVEEDAVAFEGTGGVGRRSYDLNVVTVGNDEARWKFLLELVQDRLEG